MLGWFEERFPGKCPVSFEDVIKDAGDNTKSRNNIFIDPLQCRRVLLHVVCVLLHVVCGHHNYQASSCVVACLCDIILPLDRMPRQWLVIYSCSRLHHTQFRFIVWIYHIYVIMKTETLLAYINIINTRYCTETNWRSADWWKLKHQLSR